MNTYILHAADRPDAQKPVKLTPEDLVTMAAPGCRRCYGRGYTATLEPSGAKVMCGCVARRVRAVLAAQKAKRDAQVKGGAA